MVTSTATEPSLSPTEFASAVTAITSAFGDPSRRSIYLLAHERADGLTAGEAAEALDLHPNVARRHLDKLVGGGYLVVTTTEPGSRGAGRPSKRYRASGHRISLDVPVRHDQVLIRLLGRALAELGAERATMIAEEVGEAYGREMGASLGEQGTRSVRTALHTVADALAAHGFAARPDDEDGDALQLVTEHCPFGDSATEHPVLCAVDRGMVAGMLAELAGETRVSLRSSIGAGDAVCVASLDPE